MASSTLNISRAFSTRSTTAVAASVQPPRWAASSQHASCNSLSKAAQQQNLLVSSNYIATAASSNYYGQQQSRRRSGNFSTATTRSIASWISNHSINFKYSKPSQSHHGMLSGSLWWSAAGAIGGLLFLSTTAAAMLYDDSSASAAKSTRSSFSSTSTASFGIVSSLTKTTSCQQHYSTTSTRSSSNDEDSIVVDVKSNDDLKDTKHNYIEVPHTLFVWDFDWTVINCNSDEYIPGQFFIKDEELKQRFHNSMSKYPNDWHKCVVDVISQAMEQQQDCTKQAILDSARQMPYLYGVKQAIDDIYQHNNSGVVEDGSNVDGTASKTTKQMILSDGNTLFIEEYLNETKLSNHFVKVISNTGLWDKQTNRLFVIHQSEKYGGHSCKQCSKNLCKTQALQDTIKELFPEVLSEVTVSNDENQHNNLNTDSPTDNIKQNQNQHMKKIKQRQRRPRIVYVGDGANDACPVMNVLDEGDVMLARIGRKSRKANRQMGVQTDIEAMDDPHQGNAGSLFGILPRLERYKKEDGITPKCQVLEWHTGDELRNHVTKLLKEIPPS